MGDVLVYCVHSWRFSTRLTLLCAWKLVRVLTCPPLDAQSFPYERMRNASLIYLRLHGLAGQPYLYGDGWTTAFSLEKIPDGLNDPVVFMEGCFGMQTGIPERLLECGAAAVVASAGETMNRRFRLGPAGRFGSDFVWALLRGGTDVRGALLFASVRAPKSIEDRYTFVGDGRFAPSGKGVHNG